MFDKLPVLPGITISDWHWCDNNEEGVFGEEEWSSISNIFGNKIMFTTSEDSSDFESFISQVETSAIHGNGERFVSLEDIEGIPYIGLIQGILCYVVINGPVTLVAVKG